jgi:AmmeMemoRadiSam system protein A
LLDGAGDGPHSSRSVDPETAAAARPTLSAEDKHFLLALSRRTLEAYLARGGIPDYNTVSAALLAPRATFVTLRRRAGGELRGCRGERVATQPLIDSVVHMTIASAVDDPRFPPVTTDEVPQLHIEISALTPTVRIHPDEVVVGKHGLVVLSRWAGGLLLPQVPVAYGWNREQFLRAVCEKAGLPPGAWRSEGVRLEAFEAEVWEEE